MLTLYRCLQTTPRELRTIFLSLDVSFSSYFLSWPHLIRGALVVNGSTEVESLAQAFMGISLKTTLAGLGTKLLNYANLTVLSSTGVANDGVRAITSLD